MSATPKARILLVDDDPIILDSLSNFLGDEGYEVSVASNVNSAIDALSASRYNLVITDVSMPTCDGFELLRRIRAKRPEIVVILMTSYGTIESAIEAIKLGADDYLTKPIIDDDVRMAVRRALQQQELLAENRSLRQALAETYDVANILTSDSRMAKVLDLIDTVADTSSTVLITGESGTGKSLVAHAIHVRSERRELPFVEVACGALPDTLLESELFGYMKGAFTHAVTDRQGKFAAAEDGTIFLDEVATASPQLQVKLLRVLQQRRLEPLGSNETVEVNARVILATNHDLWAAVKEGRFRRDLYYRVNVVNIELPPLRDRVGDVPLLAEHFLTKYRAHASKPIGGFSDAALAIMQRHAWPGNVRELENCVERAMVLCRSDQVGPQDLPPAVLNGQSAVSEDALYRPGVTLAEAIAGPEKQIIQAALKAHNGSRQKAARSLGIDRTTLYKKMKKHQLLGQTGQRVSTT